MKSNFTTEDQYPSNSQWIVYATVAAALLGIATNLVNFCVFWCQPVRRHYLSVSLRLLSANDLLLLLFYFILTQTNIHNWGSYTCFLTNYLYGLVTAMSPWILVVITIDRLMFLRTAATMGSHRNAKPVCLMVKLVVACSLAWNLHCRWTVSYGHYLMYNETKVCVPTATMQTHAFQLADSLIVSFLPGLILLLLNSVILCKVRRLVRSVSLSSRLTSAAIGTAVTASYEMQETTRPQAVGASTANNNNNANVQKNSVNLIAGSAARSSLTTTTLGSTPLSENNELRRQQYQITRMLLGFCFVYLAFNMPNYLALVMGQVAFISLDSSSETLYAYYNMLRLVAQLLYMLHFSTNSLIYAYSNKLFRVALIKFAGSCCYCLMCRFHEVRGQLCS